LAAEVEQRRQAEREMALVSGREQERIARELHDGLGAFLCGVAFRAKAVAEALQRRGAPEGREAQEVVRLLNRASNQVRSFAHLLAPVDEGSGGLAMALARFGAEMETAFGITCLIEIEPSLPPLADEQARELYLIIQEAARNAVLHGHATEVEVLVTHRDGQVQAIVRNDGLAWPPPEEPSEGLGLRIMRYRAGLLGGQLGFEACPGGGCRLSCCIPIHGPSIETPSHAVLAEAALPA
jgi:signal transduction histidine kinase